MNYSSNSSFPARPGAYCLVWSRYTAAMRRSNVRLIFGCAVRCVSGPRLGDEPAGDDAGHGAVPHDGAWQRPGARGPGRALNLGGGDEHRSLLQEGGEM
ncbi:hypothetical protein NDU88_004928 [Pleurodeles waltl]|uniref:Uncharacterized protein n=1 Tax=Pleurodeles waltl TaxID=8319 RepID=A0AAV7TB36_PLEWA|nr:hypothetical protein NDU88_004928 [Pleurodeles waltl]